MAFDFACMSRREFPASTEIYRVYMAHKPRADHPVMLAHLLLVLQSNLFHRHTPAPTFYTYYIWAWHGCMKLLQTGNAHNF